MKAQLKLPLQNVAGYIVNKVFKDSICLECRKNLTFNSETESHSAFEGFEYLVTIVLWRVYSTGLWFDFVR